MQIVMTQRVAALSLQKHAALIEAAKKVTAENNNVVVEYAGEEFRLSIKIVTGAVTSRVLFITFADEGF